MPFVKGWFVANFGRSRQVISNPELPTEVSSCDSIPCFSTYEKHVIAKPDHSCPLPVCRAGRQLNLSMTDDTRYEINPAETANTSRRCCGMYLLMIGNKKKRT